MKTKQPAGAGDTEATRPIVFSENVIVPTGGFEGSRFVRAGDPSPYRDPSEVPAPLRGFIVTPGDSLPEAAEERFGTYEPNVTYSMHSDGSRGRAIRRQVAELSSARAEQEWAERAAEAEAEAWPPGAKEALAAEHDARIAVQIKSLEIRDRDRDAAIAAAQEAAEREAEPAKPAEFFVKRGAVFMHAEKAKLRPGEQVFTRQPNGQWWTVGTTDINAALPPQGVIL
jgi:hypothetical protein